MQIVSTTESPEVLKESLTLAQNVQRDGGIS